MTPDPITPLPPRLRDIVYDPVEPPTGCFDTMLECLPPPGPPPRPRRLCEFLDAPSEAAACSVVRRQALKSSLSSDQALLLGQAVRALDDASEPLVQHLAEAASGRRALDLDDPCLEGCVVGCARRAVQLCRIAASLAKPIVPVDTKR